MLEAHAADKRAVFLLALTRLKRTTDRALKPEIDGVVIRDALDLGHLGLSITLLGLPALDLFDLLPELLGLTILSPDVFSSPSNLPRHVRISLP